VPVPAAFIENPSHDLAIGAVALVLVAFSLVVALVVPRRWPDFPGRGLPLFALVTVLLVGAMLASVEALGEAHHFGAAGEATTQATSSQTSTAATTTGGGTNGASTTGASTQATQTGATGGGNPAAGKQLFASNGCGSCHTYRPAGTTAQVGPDLDKLAQYARQAKAALAQFVKTSIVDPGAYVQPGYPDHVMPTNFGQKLSDQQLADLVAFLTQQ
jgi:cytochrome c551/c552